MEPENQLTPHQRSSEWYEQRLGRATASRAGDVMDYYAPTKRQLEDAFLWHSENKTDSDWSNYLLEHHPFEYCLSAGILIKEKDTRRRYREGIVAERLTGLQADPEPYVSYDMKWGIANEMIARNVYQLEHRQLITDAPFLQHKELMAGASPDGWIVDPATGEIVAQTEIKCLRSANHLYKAIMTQKVPPDHIPQIQMQLWITGLKLCVFIAYDSRVPDGLRIFVQNVPRDDLYIKVLEINIRRFLKECDNDFKHFWAMVKTKPELQNGIVKQPELTKRTIYTV